MGYAVEVSLVAEDQVQALPASALLSFAEAVTVLEIGPWGGRPFNRRNPDGAVRALPFAGDGLITYLILEDQRIVEILDVQWIDLTLDVDQVTGRARLSYRRAAELFEHATTGAVDGPRTLHQLRHSATLPRTAPSPPLCCPTAGTPRSRPSPGTPASHPKHWPAGNRNATPTPVATDIFVRDEQSLWTPVRLQYYATSSTRAAPSPCT
jgi:hypothetical protein